MTSSSIADHLLGWYDRNRRELPWRSTREPYAIWVSEMMLQQTQVATVIDYYERWMRRFPTLEALASADEQAVLATWQGLGYYSRARSLLRAARIVHTEHRGRLPRTVDELRALPGIGPYTAGAIASIAYDVRAAVVDGNVIRVLSRLHALRGDPTRAPLKAELWRRAAESVPAARPGDFNQALMELGATLCTPRKPRCGDCPLAVQCRARALGLADALPELPARAAPTAVLTVAAVVFRGRRVLLTQLGPEAPRWAGMWQFPVTSPEPGESAETALVRVVRDSAGLRVRVGGLLTSIRHGVTRYRITLDAYVCAPAGGVGRAKRSRTLRWLDPDELGPLPLPAAHRKLAERLRTERTSHSERVAR